MFWAVSGIVSFFSTLEAGIRSVSYSGGIYLGVVLVSVALIAVVVPLSAIVITTIVVVAAIVSLASVVPLSSGRCSVSINVHRDRGVVHPSWSIWWIVLRGVLSLRALIVPLRALLLWCKGLEVSISFSKYVTKEYFWFYTSEGFLRIFLVCNGCGVAHDILCYVAG